MDLSILSLLAQATLVAKAVLVVLLFMSVFSWALMFRKWMNIRAALKKAADGMDRFNHARDLREAVQSLGGISEALIATAMGLLVAIPATIGYNTFHGSLGVLETRLVNFAGMFLNRVQRELNAHRAVSRSGQAE